MALVLLVVVMIGLGRVLRTLLDPETPPLHPAERWLVGVLLGTFGLYTLLPLVAP